MALEAEMSWCINPILMKNAEEKPKSNWQGQLCLWIIATDELKHNFITLHSLAFLFFVFVNSHLCWSPSFSIKWILQWANQREEKKKPFVYNGKRKTAFIPWLIILESIKTKYYMIRDMIKSFWRYKQFLWHQHIYQ